VTKIFTEIGNQRLLLKRTESVVEYFFLHQFLNNNSLTFIGTQKELARLLSIHENSITNALTSLEKRGWIQRIRQDSQTIIKFTQLLSERLRRITFYSTEISLFLSDVEFHDEIRSINENMHIRITQLETNLQQQNEIQQHYDSHIIHISEKQLMEFAKNLKSSLSNTQDSRSLKERVLSEIFAFQQDLKENYQNNNSKLPDTFVKTLQERFLLKIQELQNRKEISE